jgi:hypothetical protein
MANAADTLERAYELIETGNVGSARNLLDTIREEQSGNPDFWWIYAHAVEDKVEGIDALDKLKALDPEYPGIAMLYREMEIGSVASGVNTDKIGQDLTGKDVSVESSPRNRRPRLLPLVAGVLVLLIVIAGISVLLNQRSGTTDSVPTVENTAIPVVIETTDEANIADAQTTDVGIVDLLSQLISVPTNGVREETTALGNTLIVSICALPGPATSMAVSSIWTFLSENEFIVSDTISAIAFASTDCTTASEFALIGVPISFYEQYRSGELNLAQLIQNHIRLN